MMLTNLSFQVARNGFSKCFCCFSCAVNTWRRISRCRTRVTACRPPSHTARRISRRKCSSTSNSTLRWHLCYTQHSINSFIEGNVKNGSQISFMIKLKCTHTMIELINNSIQMIIKLDCSCHPVHCPVVKVVWMPASWVGSLMKCDILMRLMLTRKTVACCSLLSCMASRLTSNKTEQGFKKR